MLKFESGNLADSFKSSVYHLRKPERAPSPWKQPSHHQKGRRFPAFLPCGRCFLIHCRKSRSVYKKAFARFRIQSQKNKEIKFTSTIMPTSLVNPSWTGIRPPQPTFLTSRAHSLSRCVAPSFPNQTSFHPYRFRAKRRVLPTDLTTY